LRGSLSQNTGKSKKGKKCKNNKKAFCLSCSFCPFCFPLSLKEFTVRCTKNPKKGQTGANDVEDFRQKLDHPLKDAIEAVRSITHVESGRIRRHRAAMDYSPGMSRQ